MADPTNDIQTPTSADDSGAGATPSQPATAPDVVTSPSQAQGGPTPTPSPATSPTTPTPAPSAAPAAPKMAVSQPTPTTPTAAAGDGGQVKLTMKQHMRGILSNMLESLSPSKEQAFGPHGETTDDNGKELTRNVPTSQRVIGTGARLFGGFAAGMAQSRGPGGAFKATNAAFKESSELKQQQQNRQKELLDQNLTLYRAYRQHIADEKETQETNTTTAAPLVDSIREAIGTGKFPVNEAKGIMSDQVQKTIADLHAKNPKYEVTAFPTGRQATTLPNGQVVEKNVYSVFYGDLSGLKLTANEEMSKKLGISQGAEISLPAAGRHVVNQIAQTNVSHQADRELQDNPWNTGKLAFGDTDREKAMSGLDEAGQERVQNSFLLWNKIHSQTYADPQVDLEKMQKIDPAAASDIDNYLYGAGNITKIHNGIVDYAARVKTEAQKDLENGPLTDANARSIVAMANADPTRFTKERVQAAQDFITSSHVEGIKKSVDAMETKPSEMAGENSLAAKAQLEGLLHDDAVQADPKLAVRVNRLLSVADNAHKLWSEDKVRQQELIAANAEYVKNGDPARAGQMLLDYTTTIQDMKNRNLNTKFIEDALDYAVKHSDPAHPYSSNAAEAWASSAKSGRLVDFFGNSDSLVRPGGTLDQLATSGGKISDSDYKILNEAKNWADLETGHPEISAYAATALGVADDYAKVLGGSVGSDTAREQVLNIVNPALSQPQRVAALQAMRATIYSQRDSKIGNNPFLKSMYGDIPAETPRGATTVQPAKPTTPPAQRIVPAGAHVGRDANHNIIGYKTKDGKVVYF